MDTNDIIAELESWDSVLATVSRTMPYDVPPNYFDTFAQKLNEALAAPEAVLPLTTTPSFAIPSDYFDALPVKILDKAKAQNQTFQPSKTIWLRSKWKLVRVAAAATLIACIGIISYKDLAPSKPSPQQALRNVPDTEINNYVQQHIDEFDIDLMVNNNANNIQASVNQLDPNDIQQYLDETGWNVN